MQLASKIDMLESLKPLKGGTINQLKGQEVLISFVNKKKKKEKTMRWTYHLFQLSHPVGMLDLQQFVHVVDV